MTNFLTVHYPLRYHLKKVFLTDKENWRFCDEAAETLKYLSLECIAFNYNQLKFLERIKLTLKDIMSTVSESKYIIKVLVVFLKSIRSGSCTKHISGQCSVRHIQRFSKLVLSYSIYVTIYFFYNFLNRISINLLLHCYSSFFGIRL